MFCGAKGGKMENGSASPQSLTPDPSPKGEGSRMSQGFKGFKRNNGKNGKERKKQKRKILFHPMILINISDFPKNFRYFRCEKKNLTSLNVKL